MMEELALQFLYYLPRYPHKRRHSIDQFDGKSTHSNEIDFVINPTLIATVKYDYFKTKNEYQLDMYALQSLKIKFSENEEYFVFDYTNQTVGNFFYTVVASKFPFVRYDQLMEILHEEIQSKMIVR